MIYLIPLLLIIFGIYKYDYRKKVIGKSVLYVLIGILLVIIAGWRYRLGSDTIYYNYYFSKIPLLSELKPSDFSTTRFAPGFVVFTSFCKTLIDDVVFFQLLESLIINTAVFYFFWKNTSNVFVAILFYSLINYTDLNMEVMREALAVSVFLFSWPFLKQGKWILYCLMVLLASSFHISAMPFIFLPLIYLPVIRSFFTFGTRTWIICGVLIFVSFAIRLFFIDFIRAIAVSETVIERADAYSKDNMGGLKVLNLNGIIPVLVKLVIYPGMAIYFLNKNRKSPWKMEILSVLSMYIGVLSIGIFILARYNNYVIFFSYALLSDWMFTDLKINFKRIKLDIIGWTCVIMPFLFCASFLLYNAPTNKSRTLKTYQKYYPYSSQIDKEKNRDREKIIRHWR